MMIAAFILLWGMGSVEASGRQDASAPVHQAAAAGDVEQINQFARNKADLNALDSFGYTPLKRAIQGFHPEAVKALLDGGANPNAKDAEGSTPLMQACLRGQKDVVDMLLAAKADTSLTNRSGSTALHAAVETAQLEIVEALVAAGADVNPVNNRRETPLSIAQQRANMPEIEDFLRQHGGTVPPQLDPMNPYGDLGMPQQTSQATGPQAQLPPGFVIDPNVIRADLAKFPQLDAPLKIVDANSESEQRGWVLRRTDNRAMLIRSVQKQFENEMALVKRVATEEKAAKTTKAVDDLVAARKERYEQIGTELREQRRVALQESREASAASRGGRGMTSRGARGRSTTAGGAQDPYGTTGVQARSSRRSATNAPAEPPMSAETQAQMQAWTSATAENKADLLVAVHTVDVSEYAALHKLAGEEQAVKTQTAIMALLMLREQRNAKVVQKWKEEDERLQRLQERGGANDMQQGTQPGTQPTMRRGRR
jgi:hypothetical protein